jgi:group I intron endonuclease
MESGIYQIINPLDGKIYIGSSNNIPYRWKKHVERLKSEKHHSIHLQRAWNKREYEFILETIEYCSEERLIEREQYYLDNHHPEYNISPTAGTSRGVKRRPETIEKVRQANIGKKQSSETIAKRVLKLIGKKRSPEVKEKLRIQKIGGKNPTHKYGWEKQITAMVKFNTGKKRSRLIVDKIAKALAKPVIQLTLEEVSIREWDSANQIERELGYSNSAINSVCSGKPRKMKSRKGETVYYPRRQAYGFIWKFKDDYYANK